MSARMSGTVQLSRRENGGIAVELSYDFDNSQAVVTVDSETQNFTLYPPDCAALEAYYHPFAVADKLLKSGTVFSL